MTRRVVHHKAMSVDREELNVITIYEPGIKKEDIKKMNKYSKRHGVLVKRGHFYDYIQK